jgi:hypothetical protein
VAHDEWTVTPGKPGWWSRLGQVVSPGSGRAATVPFLALLLGAVAYAGSLGLDWISTSGSFQRSASGDVESALMYGATVTGSGDLMHITAANNVTSLELMGLAYGLGALALLGLGFTVVSRPEQALRWRMAAIGLGVGLLGVVVAAVVRMPKLMLSSGILFSNSGLADLNRSYEPGLFCAVGAVILPVVAVWLRSSPAARAAVTMANLSAQHATPGATAAGTAEYDPSVWDRLYSDPGRWRRGLPPSLDLTVTPDD